MGMTTVSYNGRSFEGNDGCLAIWLALLVDEIDKLPKVPAWLREARDHWDLHATQRFDFGVMPDLEDYVTDDERRELVLGLCVPALARLRSFGDPIPASVLNQVRPTATVGRFGRDVSAGLFVATAEDFIHLLDGGPLKLAWPAPLVPLVGAGAGTT